ncbi:hypothetical protein A20C1_00701 [marine actinobacterium PHSC20C1]|nr:hypothetical protein A20C1_00701 [marine actinobacterium PHSC20C1]
MVDENELRARLSGGELPAIEIDTSAVISRSKARRRPRQLAVGTVGVLAAASLVFAGVNTFPRADDMNSAISMLEDESSGARNGSEALDSSDFQSSPATGLCGTTMPSEATAPFGLSLELTLPAEVVASGSAYGTVRLTNTSDDAVMGSTASVPDVNLLRDSVVISHSPDAQILSVMPVNLQPGQSVEFPVAIDILDCTTIDTGGMVEPGTYEVSASLAFVPSDPDVGEAAEVRSEQSSILLK